MFIYRTRQKYAPLWFRRAYLHFSILFSLFGFLRLQITAQSGTQQPEYRVFRLLIVREYALYYILGVQHGACKNMKPQQILIDFFQAWKHRLECMYHTDERSEITRVPGFMIFREKGAVSKPMIEYRLIRMRHPKAEIWQPPLSKNDFVPWNFCKNYTWFR